MDLLNHRKECVRNDGMASLIWMEAIGEIGVTSVTGSSLKLGDGVRVEKAEGSILPLVGKKGIVSQSSDVPPLSVL